MMSGIVMDMMNLLTALTGQTLPLLVTIVDVSPEAGRYTNPKEVVDFLKGHGVKVTKKTANFHNSLF